MNGDARCVMPFLVASGVVISLVRAGKGLSSGILIVFFGEQLVSHANVSFVLSISTLPVPAEDPVILVSAKHIFSS